ncbi:hypothetical protein [Streptomyces anulatus]|uniref:hypothetical protein n=1 Tax=Streptomyces anulatus TaxID=1892 RepID=UPI002F9182CF
MRTPIQPVWEDAVIGYLRQMARLSEVGYNTGRWVYPTEYHFLLARGRRFTPAPPPADVEGMKPKLCYSNAAQYVRQHQHTGLLYAEGYALPAQGVVPVGHAWCVRPDGAVIDPTWTDAPGGVYIGVAVRDAARWPRNGDGILHNPGAARGLLTAEVPEGVLAPWGRPL